ncbi:MAG TPA: GH92 family glycosyl hydrolase [Cytophagales bacterium]|nr:GH92 family glycosyl hydrolase [Cytophagales bacterium]
MYKHLLKPFFLLFITFSLFSQEKPSNYSYIDPTIGGVGLILEPTRPAVHLPNSMVRVFPARKDQLDDQISYFPLTIASHRQQWLFSIMPFSGKTDSSSWNKKFTYDQEKIKPHYYITRLEETGDTIEFTPASRSGYFQFTFVEDQLQHIRFGILNKGQLRFEGKRTITGTEEFMDMKAFFYGELNTDIIKTNYSEDQKTAIIQVGGNAKKVAFRYGISFISIEQAKANLQKEIPDWDFNSVKNKALQVWEKVMSQINVDGGTNEQKRVFYTSLYRCYERMININEYGQYYSAYDHKVHKSTEPFYVDNWMWDTYLALEPLQTLLNPKMEEDKIKSYIKMYEQGGWMPSFALTTGDGPLMTGNHSAAWILDVWTKGLRDFDLKKAYEGLKKNSLEATLLPWKNGPATSLDSFYNENGYMPALKPGEKETVEEVHDFERRQAVAVTLQNSYDDWCIAQIADILGKGKDKELFLKRSVFYKNVFREDKGFMWPKDAEGNWIEPFDPKFSGGQGGRDYFTENNAYTYNWDVKHDLQGLFQQMGGKEKAEEKLDNLFREDLGRSKYHLWYIFPDATGLVGQFVMGNEPSFHIPYLYNYLGSPWKTQKRIRMLINTWFPDNYFGIPGDEDGGGMTAFVVFSMMGFYPVTPGIPVYNIGSPSFEKISIKLSNGKTFTVNARNNSEENKYIQSAKLNGKAWNKSWFTHEELINGGILELEMGNIPNKKWGVSSPPPSALDYKPF